MIVIIFLACCLAETRGEGTSYSIRQRNLAIRDKKLAKKGKLDWIKTQYYGENRTIQDIAEELGESMVSVRKYIDEIDEIEKNKI
ncbi:MAG: hypothetical protein HWN79_17325 [Candidatus Lokiarchaeota archaeon]|nr:hypothetical protein [Candidatus Lokiarchaeota archaeon]